VRDFNVQPVRLAGRPGSRYLKVRGNSPALRAATVVEAELDGRWRRVRLIDAPQGEVSSLLWLELLE
jgi:hypothetical protein